MPKKAKSSKVTPRLGLVSLQRWLWAASGLLVIQAIAVVLLGRTVTEPLTVNYLTVDSLASAGGPTVLVGASRLLHDFNLAWLVGLLLLSLAVVNLMAVTWYKNGYQAGLQKGVNRLRWYGQIAWGGLLIVIIGLVIGVSDLASLALLCAVFASHCLLALTGELKTADKSSEATGLRYAMCLLSGAVPWVVFGLYALAAHLYGNGLPVYLYGLLGSMLLCFVAAAVIRWLQWQKRGGWADAVRVEHWYLVLNFVTVSALAWLIFFGSLRP